MAGDKGKGRDHELSEVDGKVKTVCSAVVASAASLTYNVFSTTTSYEMLGNTMGAFASLNKGQLSNSSSTASSPYIEGRIDILPKLSKSHGFHGMKLGHCEQHLPEFKKEYTRFLSNSNSIPHSRFHQMENTQTEDSHTTVFNNTSKSISPSIMEQENCDGKEIVNLLMSFRQEHYENEASEFVKTFNSLSLGGINNNSQLNFKENLDYSTRQPINLSEKGLFNFMPSFENPLTHHNQWMDLQENYTEKVWGDKWEAVENSKQANKNPIQIESKQSQNIAKRRLEAICCHLREKNPKFESDFSF
ncbi:hypothetical protein OnM2_046073 [Erysiphe neolycopersici]|uniref:Uncharacterized protein n=1 Tax=Erysiphe neolycopersici TaxID=212602 RepID=A0A420HTW2_9PEZI|nr:hypothetical protein OnM2_046073 [Erysiphe neolycopersici]